ncbi:MULTISPECIES: hypothetical protein [Streptomyces]|uniref:hypothetical protein n=1 Tax=Streptomyces TaxID=1883 RepID=UPI0008B37D4D|nr:hypothetical protein [Streptomyces sp. yr375]SES31807.1 hypothetical protein SAMN04487983_104254 [Streptomyces sp. yr375]
MARPMNPLPQTDDPLVAFARDLQALRKKVGDPPLALMAQHARVSAATLSNAHSGKKLPTWAAVVSYVLACGGDPDEWSDRWQSLRLAEAGPAGDLSREALRRWERTGVLKPISPADEAELRQLLQTLLDFNELSHRQLARQAPGYSHVTYGAVLRGARPLRAKILYQILIGCGVYSLRSQEEWFRELSRSSWKEGVAGGKLLARVEPKHRYAGDIDMKLLKDFLHRLERGRWPMVAGAALYENVIELRNAFEDMLTLLLGSMRKAGVRLPQKSNAAFNRVIGQLTSNLIPEAAAIAALVPLALPFQPRLQTRVALALKNAGEVLKQADDGELTMRNEHGVVMPRMSMWPFLPRDQAMGRVRAAS